MINTIEACMNVFNTNVSIIRDKCKVFSEAASRELEINYKEADLKVLTEHGTDNDMIALYEAAKADYKEASTKNIERLKTMVADEFNKVNTTITSRINTPNNIEAMKDLRNKMRTAPLLKKKKIMVEQNKLQQKSCDNALAKLTKLAPKLHADSTEGSTAITTIDNEFMSEHGKLIGVAHAESLTLDAVCTLAETMIKDADKVARNNRAKSDDFCKKAMDMIKSGVDPSVAHNWADTAIGILKTKTEDHMRIIQSLLREIKTSLKSYKSVQKDVADDVNTMKESTEELMTDEELSEPVSMDGYGAALNMADPVSSEDELMTSVEDEANEITSDSPESMDDVNISLESLGLTGEELEYTEDQYLECTEYGFTEAEYNESGLSDEELDSMVESAVAEAFGGEEALNNLVEEAGLTAEYAEQAELTPTVEGVYEELFGESYYEGVVVEEVEDPDKAIENLFTSIFNEATGNVPEKKEEEPVQESTFESLINMINEL